MSKNNLVSTPEVELISVIVPSYNHANYIGDTIDSIINQTYPRLELIIVDDCSKDTTKDVLSSYRSKCEDRFEKVTFHYNETNQGVVKTLNRGINEVRGTYIFSLASDDTCEPQAVETFYSFLRNNSEYGLVLGDNYLIDKHGKRCFWNKKKENVYSKKEADFQTFGNFLQSTRPDVDFNSDQFGTYASLLKGNYTTNGMFIKTCIMRDIGGYNENAPLEDLHILLQASKKTKLRFIDKQLLSYRWHGENTVLNKKKMQDYMDKTILFEREYALTNGYKKEFYHAIRFKKCWGIPIIANISLVFQRNGRKRLEFNILGISIFRFLLKER